MAAPWGWNQVDGWWYELEHTRGYRIYNVHAPDDCVGPSCPVHLPSEHPMREWPQVFIVGRMYRQCPHRKRYIDPDDPAYFVTHACSVCGKL